MPSKESSSIEGAPKQGSRVHLSVMAMIKTFTTLKKDKFCCVSISARRSAQQSHRCTSYGYILQASCFLHVQNAHTASEKKETQALASALIGRKCRLVTGGTDNHMGVWDLSALGVTGRCYEKVCELCHITLNKFAVYGDNCSLSPGGVRIDTPAMTARGCLEADFETIADFLLRAAQIAVVVQREQGKQQKDLKGPSQL